MPLWRRALKTALALAATAALSYWFGRTGVVVAGGVALLAFGYVHGIWLPRHGVNGWTAEPWERYANCEAGPQRRRSVGGDMLSPMRNFFRLTTSFAALC